MNAHGSPRAHRSAGTLFRSRSIRAQLVRILSVALVLVLALLGVLVAGQANDYIAASRATRVVTVTLSVQNLVHQLQRERGLTNGMLGGGRQFASQIPPQRTQTDAALVALNQTIDNPANADAGADRVHAALAGLNALASQRGDVDRGQVPATTTFQFYTGAIAMLNNLELGLDQAQDDSLRHGLQALYALGAAKEYTGQERGLLNGVFPTGHFSIATYRTFAQILGQKQAALASYDIYAALGETQALATALRSSAATQASADESLAVDGASGTIPGQVDGTVWWNTMTQVIDDMRTVQQSVGADVTARASTLRTTALAWLVGIIALALIAIGILVALLVAAARSIIGPLAALVREADDVSSARLPAVVEALQTADDEGDVPRPAAVAVPEKAAREIRLVAGALDRVQGTAFALASEQALVRRNITASLANLGRRNQNLLRRQLGLISEFERAELDPTTLANLFELDHLATRMRRNAESLLVLVGENGPRPWGRPLPVTDVIRAALSEVDDYRRVAMRRVDDAHISGAVVAEVAHMLAELVENALAFSSPDLEVEIYGRATDRGYLLVVLDHGVGMSADELAKARARLRDEENFLVTPTRFLGHYVVGRLARRLAVTVELYESPVTGITARMILPSDLLADPSSGDDTPVAANVPASPPAKTTESADSASATNGAKGINGIAAKRITWPGGIPADVDTAGEMNTVDTPDVVPAQNSGGRNGHHRADPERTRNGLVKRHPRARPSVHRPNPSRPQPDREAPVRDRTPTEVSTMLAAFRGGHQRGESTQPPTEGS